MAEVPIDINEAKRKVIESGLRLQATGLIARTWGNISCRIDPDSFVITPSGKGYEGLSEEDIVKIRLSDESFEGDVKPSSERGVHAALYKLHPNINFIIHTHQLYATAVGVAGEAIDGLDEYVMMISTNVNKGRFTDIGLTRTTIHIATNDNLRINIEH